MATNEGADPVGAGEPVIDAEWKGDTASETESHEGEQWSSRWAFIACAIGSAVGLGNVWRFPYLVFEYGGGAFFVPYLLSLILVGFPMMAVELSLSQIWQLNPIGVHYRIQRRVAGVGVLGYCNSFLIASFYGTIIAWTEVYMVASFFNPLPWVVDDADRAACAAPTNETACLVANGGECQWRNDTADPDYCEPSILGKAQNYYYETCNIGDPYNPSRYSGWMVLAHTIVWLTVFGLLAFGAKVLGYIMYVTMALPTISIVALVVVGLTLEGASKGIQEYVGKWNGDILTDRPEVWSEATGQVFFTLSIGSAVMMVFSSYNQPNNPMGQDAIIIGCADTLFAFLAGFAVFSVAGFLADSSGLEVSELQLSGGGLAFMTYPVGMAELGYPGGNILCFIFFLTLWLIGIDSLVAMVEPFINLVFTSKYRKKSNRLIVTAGYCAGFWLISLIYCADFGATLLDEVDYYCSNLGLLFCGLFNSLSFGWVYNGDVAMAKVGVPAYLTSAVTLVVGAMMGTIFALLIPAGNYIGPILFVSIVLCGQFAAPFIAKDVDDEGNRMSFSTKLYWTSIGSMERTRAEINDIAHKDMAWWTLGPLTVVWGFLVKYVNVVVLTFLIGNLTLRADFWLRPGIPEAFTVLGLLGILVGGILPCFLAACLPWLFEPITPERALDYVRKKANQNAGGKDSNVHVDGPFKSVDIEIGTPATQH